MSIETKIYAALSLSAISNGDGTFRCYPDTLPQLPTYPAIAYQRVSSTPSSLTQVARFRDYHFQITLHAITKASLMSLRSNVLDALIAMPERVTDNELSTGYEAEPKAFNSILDVQFRDTD